MAPQGLHPSRPQAFAGGDTVAPVSDLELFLLAIFTFCLGMIIGLMLGNALA